MQFLGLNLLGNPVDAIESGSKKSGMISISTEQEKDQIVVRFTDDGPGILKEHERKRFDPFFTTKQTGKGAGLGLSICYNIVEKMGGTISCENREPGGAVFPLRLPLGGGRTGGDERYPSPLATRTDRPSLLDI